MPSIESSPYPLIFKIKNNAALPRAPHEYKDKIAIRTLTRALKGMQKEAIVNDSYSNTAWRMVCDEGPWLNGTDLSSFPLGFFSTGMIASLAAEIMALADQRGIAIRAFRIIQDARYTLAGSAVKQTMTGSALPLETEVHIRAAAAQAKIQELIYHALAASPADAVMRNELHSRFKISKNGKDIDTGKVRAAAMINSSDPLELFDRITPVTQAADVITRKLEGEDTSGEKPATALGMAAEQKRLIQVRAILSLREDGLKSVKVQCIQPAGGSVFNFLSDAPACFGGQERAPTGLQYLSAGVAFCFMTQLGRFAGIVKQDLTAYRIVQDSCFSLPGASAHLQQEARAYPVDTHVFLSSAEADEASRILVQMGEQTCYLHACYRGIAKTRLRITTAE